MGAYSQYSGSTYHGGGFSTPQKNHLLNRKPKVITEETTELTSLLRTTIEAYRDELSGIERETEEHFLINSVIVRLELAQEELRNGTSHESILKTLLHDLKSDFKGLDGTMFHDSVIHSMEGLLDSVSAVPENDGTEELDDIPTEQEFEDDPLDNDDVEEPDNEEFNNLIQGLGKV